MYHDLLLDHLFGLKNQPLLEGLDLLLHFVLIWVVPFQRSDALSIQRILKLLR